MAFFFQKEWSVSFSDSIDYLRETHTPNYVVMNSVYIHFWVQQCGCLGTLLIDKINAWKLHLYWDFNMDSLSSSSICKHRCNTSACYITVILRCSAWRPRPTWFNMNKVSTPGCVYRWGDRDGCHLQPTDSYAVYAVFVRFRDGEYCILSNRVTVLWIIYGIVSYRKSADFE